MNTTKLLSLCKPWIAQKHVNSAAITAMLVGWKTSDNQKGNLFFSFLHPRFHEFSKIAKRNQ